MRSIGGKKRARQRDAESDYLFGNRLRRFRWRAVCVTGPMCSEAVLEKEGEPYADSGCDAETTPIPLIALSPKPSIGRRPS